MTLISYPQLTGFIHRYWQSSEDETLLHFNRLTLDGLIARVEPAHLLTETRSYVPDLIQKWVEQEVAGWQIARIEALLRDLALHVGKQLGYTASDLPGIDLEFDQDDTRYIVSIKSGSNWGNSSQKTALASNFRSAVRVLSQSRRVAHIQPVLGICYGRKATTNNGTYMEITGQSFWHFLSGNPALYTDIIEPIGYEARRHNAEFEQERTCLYNVLTREFSNRFCRADGAIDWPALVAFNSGNLIEA